MKKTRVLASLLCLMMVLSVIPMMQVTAAVSGDTITQTELMAGYAAAPVGGIDFCTADVLGTQNRTQIANFTSSGTETNFATLYPVTLTEETPTSEDSDGKYIRYIGHNVAADHPGWSSSAERKAQVNFWPTNKAGSLGTLGLKYGSEGNESYLLKYRFRLFGTGAANIQTKAKSKITLNLANNSTFKPADVGVTTGAEGTWHEVIVVVGNANSTPKTFTYWYSNNNSDTYTYAGSAEVADGSEQDGQLTFEVEAGTTMELDHILMYGKSGATKTEVLGNKAVILNNVLYDAEWNALNTEANDSNAKMDNSTGANKGSSWWDSTNGCINVGSTGEYRINWKLNGEKYLLDENMAVEVSFVPYRDNTCVMTARLAGGEKCLYLQIMKNGSIQDYNGTEVWANTNTSTSFANVNKMLIVYRNSKLELYKKLDNGNYSLVNTIDPQASSVLTGNAATYSMMFKGTVSSANGCRIFGLTRYALNVGAVDSETLTNVSSTLFPYVEEDFESLNQASYIAEATYAEGKEDYAGNVTAGTATDGGKAMVLTNCTNGGSGRTSFTASDAGIPKGGYAEVQFKMQGHLQWDITDGETGIYLYFRDAFGTTTYTTSEGTANVDNVAFVPNKWYDLRIVRGENGNYSAYVKEAGETAWIKMFEDKAGKETENNMIMVHTGSWSGGFATSNLTTKQYVRDLAVYGPLSKAMTVLDGSKTTLAPVEGATLKYGAKVVLQPSDDARTLIFAGYDDEKNLIAAEPVTIAADNDGKAEVVFPSNLNDSKIDDIKVFLWDGFDNMNVVAPMQSFAK